MSPKKVLVVDDHDDSRDICRQLLGFYGYDVVVSDNGRDAIQQAIVEKPDLVLLDLRLPDGDGLQTLAELRQAPNLQDTRIVLYTAAITEREQLLAVEGVDRVLFKPVESAHLVEAVRTLIGTAESEPFA